MVVYRAVGKYTGDELSEWLPEADRDRVLTVLVGAASRRQVVRTSLPEAYRRHAGLARPPRMGGVVIAERHADAVAEHERMLRKQDAGCEFFVSQVCYDLHLSGSSQSSHLPRRSRIVSSLVGYGTGFGT